MILTLGLLSAQTAWAAEAKGPRAPAPADCKPVPMMWANRSAADVPPPPDGSRGFDVLSYDLELRLDPGALAIAGLVTIRLAAVPSPMTATLDTVVLDLVPELLVTGLTDGQGTLAHVHQGSRLAVALRTPLVPGATKTLIIAWSGRPPRHGSFAAGLMFRTHDPGTPSDPVDDVPVIANMSEPWSAHSWWPCKDHPSDKALVSLAVTVPDSLSVVANGRLLDVSAADPGWHRYAWREAYPLPTYLVSVAVSNYESWSEDCGPGTGPAVHLEYHVFPEDRVRAETDLAATCEMMTFLTDRLGPWPFAGEKYAQVEFKWIGGMEHTTATSLAQLLFTGDGRYENLFLHEMSHQWFGDCLTPARWADIWLSEGLARYCEALWVEHRHGSAAYDDFMATIGRRGHPQLFAGDGILADPVPILPSTLVYDKGAWVLHMLRRIEGDEVFFAFLRDYAQAPDRQQALVTTDDLINTAETAAGRSLAGFFTPWLQTDLVPVISHVVHRTPPGVVHLTLTQHQTPTFEVPVSIVAHTSTGEQRLLARLTQPQQSFQWQVPGVVDSVTVAADDRNLLRTLASPPLPLVVTGPNPNPAGNAGAAFMLFPTKSSHVVVNIYDTRGTKLTSEDLGELSGPNPAQPPAAPGHPWRWLPQAPGRPALPAGIYHLEFLGAGGRQVKSVVYLH
jgi:aminopeptidase N